MTIRLGTQPLSWVFRVGSGFPSWPTARNGCAMLGGGGLRPGDNVAVLMDNAERYFTAVWGARRAGLLFTPVNRHLTPTEVTYIVRDCGARALVTSTPLLELAAAVADKVPSIRLKLCSGRSGRGFTDFDDALPRFPAAPLSEEVEGTYMFYSSGTTGRPKGIRPDSAGGRSATLRGSSSSLPVITVSIRMPVPLHRSPVPRRAAGLVAGGQRFGDRWWSWSV